MLEVLLYIIFTITQSKHDFTPNNICNENVSHLSYNNQITFHIGCSKVDGSQVYPNYLLKRIKDGK